MHALSSLGSRSHVSSHLPINAVHQCCDKKQHSPRAGPILAPQEQQLHTSNRLATSCVKRSKESAPARRATRIVQCSRSEQGDSGNFLAIYHSLACLTTPQLRLAAASDPALTSSEFLFFLRDLEEQARKAEQAGRHFTVADLQGPTTLHQEAGPARRPYQGPITAQQEAGSAWRHSDAQESPDTMQQEQQPPGLHVQQQQLLNPQQDGVQGSSPQFTVAVGGAEGGMNAAVWRPSGTSGDNSSSGSRSRNENSSSSNSSRSRNDNNSSSSRSSSSNNNAAWQPLGKAGGAEGGASRIPVESRSTTAAQVVARVAAELVAFREEQELQASSRLLPSLASSLAYDNLLRWRREQQNADGSTAGSGGDLAVGGVPVEELYKAGEKQERRLKEEQQRLERLQAQQRPTWASSGCDFLQAHSTAKFLSIKLPLHTGAALDCWLSRPSKKVAVLDALLSTGQEWGRAGWADQMHEAFYPPGIKRKRGAASRTSPPPAAGTPPQPTSEQQQQEQEESQYELVCTSPEALRDAITARMEERRMQSKDDSSVAQLTELLEDLEDYVKHVWSLRNPLERYG
ncbi:hypothetical protein DUNSADRAFT_15129 [Dunaliella salina]|uniref:Uncharacterized protein n=1 Tax=Dunaliella salina TaxID=3046 RepID=A0ABQ7H237_DUNSA|nr:hypothetical protein DUNSADRAFT_15129 [Dunaliella salina]|eukprot:KAF5840928.1 hypothetical protein DUNSADRAFT_15129 [Dunaliella salina]